MNKQEVLEEAIRITLTPRPGETRAAYLNRKYSVLVILALSSSSILKDNLLKE